MSDAFMPLTDEERKAIASLKRLAKKWPPSLWLFTNGAISIMKNRPDGTRAITITGGVDPDYTVDSIGEQIPSDGGDW